MTLNLMHLQENSACNVCRVTDFSNILQNHMESCASAEEKFEVHLTGKEESFRFQTYTIL
jgi:hypothetical protein